MNRTLKVLIGAALISLASLGTATAQTGTLQGARLFLYDGGLGSTLNRIGLFTPPMSVLTSDYNLTLPAAQGSSGDFLYNTDGAGTLGWTNGNGMFWRLDGNASTTPWNGVSGNFLGTNDPQDLVIRAGGANSIQFWNGAASQMVMDINPAGNVGIGMGGTFLSKLTVVDFTGLFDGGYYQINKTGGTALSAWNTAPGGMALRANAQDVGVGVGQFSTPVNGMEIDASGVGILINKWGMAPAVGISMDGSATGVLVENSSYGVAVDGAGTGLYVRNAANSIDANGMVMLNNNWNAPVMINTGSATGTTTVGNASAGTVSVRSGSDVMIQVPGAASGNDLVLTGIDLGAATTKILTLDGANNVRYRNISAGPNIVTGSGTNNTIVKWTPDGATIGNSNITDNGSLVTVSSPLTQTGATNINTSGAALTTIGTAGNTVRLASNDVEMTALPAGAVTDDFVSINASNDVRRVAASTFINGTAWKLGGNNLAGNTIFGSLSAHDVIMQTAGTTRLTLSSAGAITQSGAGQVTFTGNVDANSGLDVTGLTTVVGTTQINTTGAATTTIGSTGTGGIVNVLANNDITLDPGAASGDVVINNVDVDTSVTRILGLDASNNLRTRAITGGSVATGSGTLNTIVKWTPNGMTLGNSNITDNGSLVTVTSPLTQAGGGQVTLSGNVDANGGLDVAGTTTVVGGTSINIAGANGTTIGAAANQTRLLSGDVEMTNLPAGAGTDDFVTITGVNGDVRRTSSATIIGATAWKLGGNTLSGATIFGSLSAHDVVMQTAGTTRLTLTSAGAITQSGAGQVTFTGNVDANSGLDVLGTTTVAGTTTINTTGAATTGIGSAATGGAVSIASASSITLNPSAAGDIKAMNVDNDEATAKVLTLDASDNVRYRNVPSTGTILTGSGTPNRHAKWVTATTLGDGNILDVGTTLSFVTNDVRLMTTTPTYSAGSAPGTKAILVTDNTTGQVQQVSFPGTYAGRGVRVVGQELQPTVMTDDGTNVGVSTTGSITLASTTSADVTINVTGAGGNDLVLTGIDVDNTATKVVMLDASNNVRTRSIGPGGTILAGAGTLNQIPKWTPDGFTLGDSKISDNGTDVTVDGTANFNANGNVNLGDATADAVTIKGNLKTTGAANQFAGRTMITGAPGTTTFVIPNTLVAANSIILVSLEDGTSIADFTATVSAKTPGVSFTVRLSSVMTPAQTKWVNYQIINQ